jgi:anti-sigma factor ChrR (cupin superfamily)
MQTQINMIQRVRNGRSGKVRFHLNFAGIWNEGVWLAPRPGIKVRELFQSDDGYRISMVRYAPGSKVPDHLHTGDEHTYVLEGSLRDSAGEYRAGAYLMSPMGSHHRVWSDRGALVITHRLGPVRFLSGWAPGPEAPPEGRGFPGERMPITVETGAGQGAVWEELCMGIEIMSLFEGHPGTYKTALLRYHPGSAMPAHIHLGDEHAYILSGCQEDEYGSYDAGGYIYNPIGTAHRVWSEEGCLALLHWRAPFRYL